jgi:IS30 family transposase
MARRPKPGKLELNPLLCREVVLNLVKDRSPEQISARLKIEFPDDLEMRISPETIYQSIYVQARGTLRKDLAKHLRGGRARRKHRDVKDRRGQLTGMVMISERPPEIEDRAVPGHWEGDLIVGKQGRSFVGTLVERHTRFVMLVHLGREKNTEIVCEKIGQKILTLPENLRRSLTWDQGREMAAHVKFTQTTGLPVYFCEPHSPWQRGSNENTNGLLRQYLPKSTDLAEFGQVELDTIATKLNDRPRKTLDWMTPAEKLNEVLLR